MYRVASLMPAIIFLRITHVTLMGNIRAHHHVTQIPPYADHASYIVYRSVGAVATLYDISCLGIAAATIHQGAFFGIEDKVFNLTLPDPLASFSSANDHLIEQATGQKMHAVGHHFFVPVDGPGGNASAATLNPRFDVAEQSVVAAKSSVGYIPYSLPFLHHERVCRLFFNSLFPHLPAQTTLIGSNST